MIPGEPPWVSEQRTQRLRRFLDDPTHEHAARLTQASWDAAQRRYDAVRIDLTRRVQAGELWYRYSNGYVVTNTGSVVWFEDCPQHGDRCQ